MVIKIVALGPMGYASNKLNLFDGIICMVSIIDFGTYLTQCSRTTCS